MNNIKFTFVLLIFISTSTYGESGFVSLPSDLTKDTAYVTCNTSGDFGRSHADLPKMDIQNNCAIFNDALKANSLASPIEGFRLVGVQASDVEISHMHSGRDKVVARLSEAIWRDKENTECILAAHLEMYDAPLADGKYFEVNDIAHAGFAKRNVMIAYYHKPHSSEPGGNTEVLFRAGRTYTSAKTEAGQQDLPRVSGAPVGNAPFSFDNTAKVSDNWVVFTTDVSFKDTDRSTRAISPILYIKYDCDARDPINKANAIRLRSIGNSSDDSVELSVPGLIPVDAEVELF